MGGNAGAALKEDGTVILWGDAENGGSNNTDVDLTNIVAIYMGIQVGAALKNTGEVVVWGLATKGGSVKNQYCLTNIYVDQYLLLRRENAFLLMIH